MKISELVGKFNNNETYAVTVATRKLASTKTRTFSGSFPKKNVMIIGIYKYYDDLIQVAYVGRDSVRNTFNLPPDFEVVFAEDKMKESIERAYQKYLDSEMLKIMTQGIGGSVGSDPEIFVTDQKGELIPAFNFLDVKKGKTTTEQDDNQVKYSVYWDGFQAEFETGPRTCLAYHVDTVQLGLAAVLKYARQHNKGAKLSLNTVMPISEELLRNSKPEHVALGCMPSMNAYGIEVTIPNGMELPFRSTGGHIHFGIGKKTKEEYDRMVKAMDAIIGVACVSLFAGHDSPARRQYYGLPGEYRTPPHGLEYRTLSNAWLAHPMINHLVFDIARRALVVGKNNFLSKAWKHDEAETIRIIRECDVEAARKVLTENKDNMLRVIRSAYTYREQKDHEVIFNIFMNGMSSVIKDVHDIEGNWHLTDGKWITHTGNTNATVSSFLTVLKAEEAKKAA